MTTLNMIALGLLMVTCFEAAMAVDCPSGYSPHGNNCYLFVNQHYSWFEAQASCWSMGARLVEIETAEENNFVGGLIRGHHADFAWTGMTDFAKEGTFMLTSQHVTVRYTHWRAGEPNDHYGSEGEDCVFMAPDSKWLDAECHSYRKPFVCEIQDDGLSEPGIVG